MARQPAVAALASIRSARPRHDPATLQLPRPSGALADPRCWARASGGRTTPRWRRSGQAPRSCRSSSPRSTAGKGDRWCPARRRSRAGDTDDAALGLAENPPARSFRRPKVARWATPTRLPDAQVVLRARARHKAPAAADESQPRCMSAVPRMISRFARARSEDRDRRADDWSNSTDRFTPNAPPSLKG
jgi:hypothetical protein